MGALDDLADATERTIEATEGLVAVSKPREERGYVVLLRYGDGGVTAGGADTVTWRELGVVTAFNRPGALEQAEERWPEELAGQPQLHLIPERFWQEITPEEQPPPPPRRKWKGL